MHKIAILGSDDFGNALSIKKFFKNDDIEFCHITNENNLEDFFNQNKFNLIVLSGFKGVLKPEIIEQGVFLNIHDSLLPNYNVENPIEEAFNNKEKITGVSVYLMQKNPEALIVISQQAVEISENLSLEDLKQKIKNAENYLYPRVIEELLFSENVACKKEGGCSGSGCSDSGCGGNCGGCG